MTAVQMARLGISLGWDREDTARDMAERHGMTFDDACGLWDHELRQSQERDIADAHDEALDAEARRQEHRAA
jgi:hypothetical protein